METGRTGIEYQKIVSIDGEEYKILALTPEKGFKLGLRVMKIVGAPVAALAQAGGDESKASEFLSGAVKALMANLDEDQTLDLFKRMLYTCEHNSKLFNDSLISQHFQGRLGHMMKLVAEVMEFQFRDFFVEIGQAISKAMGKVAVE